VVAADGKPRRARPTPRRAVDDVGFSDFGCYGSAISADHRRLAAEGLAYSGSTQPRMCSTERARPLLTGAQPYSAVGCLAIFDSGFRLFAAKIAREAGTLAECCAARLPHYMVGKWQSRRDRKRRHRRRRLATRPRL